MDRQLEAELMDLPEEARAYARGKFTGVNEALLARLFEQASKNLNGATVRMVDLGTGPGSIPVMIAKAKPTWHITAVDAAKAMLTIAQVGIKMAGLHKQIKVHQGDVKETGLPAASFDLVFSNSVLHHMPDAVPFWEELKRLTAPGGMIFVGDLRRPDSEAAARKLVELHAADETPLMQEEFYRSLLAAFTPGDVQQQLAAVGLGHLTVEAIGDRHLDVYGVVK